MTQLRVPGRRSASVAPIPRIADPGDHEQSRIHAISVFCFGKRAASGEPVCAAAGIGHRAQHGAARTGPCLGVDRPAGLSEHRDDRCRRHGRQSSAVAVVVPSRRAMSCAWWAATGVCRGRVPPTSVCWRRAASGCAFSTTTTPTTTILSRRWSKPPPTIPKRCSCTGAPGSCAPMASSNGCFGRPFNRALIHYGSLFCWQAALIRRKVVDLGCRFDEALEVCEDRDFLVQIAEHSDFAFVPVVGFNYRPDLGTSGTSRREPRRRQDQSASAGCCARSTPERAPTTPGGQPCCAGAPSTPTTQVIARDRAPCSRRCCASIPMTRTACTASPASSWTKACSIPPKRWQAGRSTPIPRLPNIG